MNAFIYAETFKGVQPHEVHKVVPLRWWKRWMKWCEARFSQRLHQAKRAGGLKVMDSWTQDELQAYMWTMIKDEEKSSKKKRKKHK